MDVDYRAEIEIATQEALDLADELVVELGAGGRVSSRTLQLAIDYGEKRRYIRRLRRALKVEVGG